MQFKTPLQIKAYDYIKERILNGSFHKDLLYSETKLAQEIGISRTPMREALQCLSQDGYINIFPSKGFTIRQLSEKDMKETIQVRCALEGFCTYLISKDIRQNTQKSRELIKKLRETLDLQHSAKDIADGFHSFIHYDHQFHLLLVNYAGNDEFNEIFQKLMYLIQLTSQTALSVKGRVDGTLTEHEKYFQLLEMGDGEAAYDTLMEHLCMPVYLHIVD